MNDLPTPTQLEALLPSQSVDDPPPAAVRARPPQARARLVLFPGLLSTPREFGMIAHAWQRHGVRATALAVPGYSDGDPRRPVRFDAWLDGAARALDDAVRVDRDPTAPLVLGGLCVGGMIAAALALRRPGQVVGVAMISPTWRYDGWALTRWLAWRHLAYALRLDRFISVSERAPFGIRNRRIRAWIAHDMAQRARSDAGPARLPLWAIGESERLTHHVRENLHALAAPLLTVHATRDEITSIAAVSRELARHGPRRQQLVAMRESYHMVPMDNDRHRAVEAIARFVHCTGRHEAGRTHGGDSWQRTSRPRPDPHEATRSPDFAT